MNEKAEKKAEKKIGAEKKLGKNILSRIDKGDHVEEMRRVDRDDMEKALTYSLKIPKTLESAKKLYGEAYCLQSFIATLRTDSDDAIERQGKPAAEDKAIRTAIKGASPEIKAQVLALLNKGIGAKK